MRRVRGSVVPFESPPGSSQNGWEGSMGQAVPVGQVSNSVRF